MAEITFIVKPDGSIHIEVEGVVGPACSDLTRAYEEALGIKVSTNEKPQFYEVLDGVEQKVEEW